MVNRILERISPTQVTIIVLLIAILWIKPPVYQSVERQLFSDNIVPCEMNFLVNGDNAAVEDAITYVDSISDVNLRSDKPERTIIISTTALEDWPDEGTLGVAILDEILISPKLNQEYELTRKVAIHEIGHQLGIGHNDRDSSIMNEAITAYTGMDQQDFDDFRNACG